MESKLSEKLWDLANLITGFAIAQAIAYLYSLGKNDGAQSIAGLIILVVLVLIIFFHILYMWAVLWCHTRVHDLETKAKFESKTETKDFRVAVIKKQDLGVPACQDNKVSFFIDTNLRVARGQIIIIGSFGILTFLTTCFI